MSSGSWLHRRGPLASAALLLLVLVVLALQVSLNQNQGRLIYPLDDTYIHMAMAKNLSQHSVWGVSEDGFSSTSSSLLWTLLLSACFFLFGPHPAIPLILALLCALALLAAVDQVLRRRIAAHDDGGRRASSGLIVGVLVLVVLLTPLPTLVLVGMEHVLQALVVLGFAALAAATLCPQSFGGDQNGGRSHSLPLPLLLLAPMVSLVRFEGLFLIAAVSLLCLLRRRLLLAVSISGLALLPVGIYGAVSVAKGWSWLPNSILLKGNVPQFGRAGAVSQFLGHAGYWKPASSIQLLVLALAAILVLYLGWKKSNDLWRPSTVLILIFLITTGLHSQLAGTGWLFRYEAYLVTLGTVVLAAAWAEGVADGHSGWRRGSLLLLPLVVVFLLLGRTGPGLKQAVQCMNDRYFQHFYPAQFVRRHYGDSTIAINDIGLMAFHTEARILDLYGLANMEPLRFRRSKGGYGRREVETWTQSEGAKVAILQVQWSTISSRIPENWVQVGEWEIPRNVLFGDTRIGFFAVAPGEGDALAAKLRRFSSQVPEEIVQRGRYVEAGSPPPGPDSAPAIP